MIQILSCHHHFTKSSWRPTRTGIEKMSRVVFKIVKDLEDKNDGLEKKVMELLQKVKEGEEREKKMTNGEIVKDLEDKVEGLEVKVKELKLELKLEQTAKDGKEKDKVERLEDKVKELEQKVKDGEEREKKTKDGEIVKGLEDKVEGLEERVKELEQKVKEGEELVENGLECAKPKEESNPSKKARVLVSPYVDKSRGQHRPMITDQIQAAISTFQERQVAMDAWKRKVMDQRFREAGTRKRERGEE